MGKLSINEDNYEYFKYVGPQCLKKALSTLHGFLEGVVVDNILDPDELEGLKSWMREHQCYADRHPFNEIYHALEVVVNESEPDIEDVKDILWMCGRRLEDDSYFRAATNEMQRLQGLLAGILADGKITKSELEGLIAWMQEHDKLKGCWPFDEVESLITSVLRDGVVDTSEQELLKQFFSEFINTETHKSVSVNKVEEIIPLSGVCSLCPEIEFSSKVFCFTGKFKKAPRKKLATVTESLGGVFTNSISKDVHYLVIGSDGNESWAFSCYGRKVEEAIQYRKKGHNILLVHEFDYWDAVEDKLAAEDA